jgi:hypothetical protein
VEGKRTHKEVAPPGVLGIISHDAAWQDLPPVPPTVLPEWGSVWLPRNDAADDAELERLEAVDFVLVLCRSLPSKNAVEKRRLSKIVCAHLLLRKMVVRGVCRALCELSVAH